MTDHNRTRQYDAAARIALLIALAAILSLGVHGVACASCEKPDFQSAARTLGVSERQIMDALGDPTRGPDFSAAANQLGTTESALLRALHISAGAELCPPPGGAGASMGHSMGQGQSQGQRYDPWNADPRGKNSLGGGGYGRTSYGLTRTVTVHGIDFKVNYSTFSSFADLPGDIRVERQPVEAFTRPEGGTHYYEAVYVPTKNVSWVQAAILAESAGGYLTSITSAQENAFVFSLVDDEKFFWAFPDDYTPDSHYGIKIGPFLGGTKTDGSSNSRSGWVWLSGEKWDYANWCRDLGDGRIDKDPRPNDQPNGRGRQNVMGFGELNVPVPYWGDYFSAVAQYENMPMPAGFNYGFVIEYDSKPN